MSGKVLVASTSDLRDAVAAGIKIEDIVIELNDTDAHAMATARREGYDEGYKAGRFVAAEKGPKHTTSTRALTSPTPNWSAIYEKRKRETRAALAAQTRK